VGGLIGDSGWLGVITAPASFTAWNVVPGGVCGGRLSTIRLVWSTSSKIAIDMVATMAAITAGFRKVLTIPVNASSNTKFRFDHPALACSSLDSPRAAISNALHNNALAAVQRRDCPAVNDAHLGVFRRSIADCRRPSAELRFFHRRQYRKALFQKSDGDPVAIPKPISQIGMARPGPHLIFDNAQDTPENQVIVASRRSASRNRIGVSPKLRDGIALAP
jgi:hypothetical protein